MSKNETPITYASSGVDYGGLDPFKVAAQKMARGTFANYQDSSDRPVEESLGESAGVMYDGDGDMYTAHVVEGLGTKNLVADSIYNPTRLSIDTNMLEDVGKHTGKTHYDALAQDGIAMIVNDLITVGARPSVLMLYSAVGSADWFNDERRAQDLIDGFGHAAKLADAIVLGGETPALKGIIYPDKIDISGSGFGKINPKDRLTIGDHVEGRKMRLDEGDAIFLVESSGIHSNGLTAAREIARKISEKKGIDIADAYATELSDGRTYGETLLTPTHIYSRLVEDLYMAGVDIHYMVNITGHGWRKLMRANRELSYIIDQVPDVSPIFKFIQEQSEVDDSEMYGNYNMDAGFGLFIPDGDVEQAKQIAKDNHGLESLKAGNVEKGPRQVVIRPRNIEFKGESLAVR